MLCGAYQEVVRRRGGIIRSTLAESTEEIVAGIPPQCRLIIRYSSEGTEPCPRSCSVARTEQASRFAEKPSAQRVGVGVLTEETSPSIETESWLSSPAKSPKRIRYSARGVVCTKASSKKTSAWFITEKAPTETSGSSSLLLLLVRLVLTEPESAEEASTRWLLLGLLSGRGLTKD